MMRADHDGSLRAADIVIDVPLKDFGSLDWRRSDELIPEGYEAAEAMRDRLLPLAVSEADYRSGSRIARAGAGATLPPPTFVRVEGFDAADARRLTAVFAPPCQDGRSTPTCSSASSASSSVSTATRRSLAAGARRSGRDRICWSPGGPSPTRRRS